MSTEVFLFGVYFCAVAWFVLTPLYHDSKMDVSMFLDESIDSQKTLQLKRSELMLTLRDLDFDYETGKLSKEDYQALREKYQGETVEVLKKIDDEKDAWDKFQKQLDSSLKKS